MRRKNDVANELGRSFRVKPQGLIEGRASELCPWFRASLSQSSKAGRAKEIWLLKESLAFSKAPSWAGKAREASLIMGSTSCSVSSRYESCLATVKALPMEEWLWKRSAAFTMAATGSVASMA